MAIRESARRAPASDGAARRRELFALVAPLFSRLGYREVTLKELATAVLGAILVGVTGFGAGRYLGR